MAFQQPQKRPQLLRQTSYAASGDLSDPLTPHSLHRASNKRALDTSEEWVLFSPVPPSVTQTQTTSTDRTPRTAGLSRLSDIGSLDTAARSDHITVDGEDNEIEQASEEGDLDSLDDGLHAFREPSDYGSPRHLLHRSGETVLPTHDGLGTFGDSSAAIQTQLWQYEREAHRRKHGRRASSVQRQLEALEEVDEYSEETEKFRRVEMWRLEQSRALLEEIERETRRMRRLTRSTARSQRTESITGASAIQTKSEYNFSSGRTTPAAEQEPQCPDPVEVALPIPEENEGFWQRITRKVIKELIGIDEEVLSIILGEALPEEAYASPVSSMGDITKDKALETVGGGHWTGETWQHRLLERVARELGTLVHQLSEHPGAFTTYLKATEAPPYAGITNSSTSTLQPQPRPTPIHHNATSSTSALFAPTLHNNQVDPSLFGIEEEVEPEEVLAQKADATAEEREYWERELDVKMVFNFLKNRFSSRPSSPDSAHIKDTVPYVGSYPSPSRRPSAISVTSGRTGSQRAALIRQAHPLALRAEQSKRKDGTSRMATSHNPVPQNLIIRSHLGVRTRSDSCASQSTKKSRKSGSSRNYWDLGGSVGSGPAGLGVLGEVGI